MGKLKVSGDRKRAMQLVRIPSLLTAIGVDINRERFMLHLLRTFVCRTKQIVILSYLIRISIAILSTSLVGLFVSIATYSRGFRCSVRVDDLLYITFNFVVFV